MGFLFGALVSGKGCQDDCGVEDRTGGTNGTSRDAPQPSSVGTDRQTGSACLGAQYGPQLLSLSSQVSCARRWKVFLSAGSWVPKYQELGSSTILRFLTTVFGGVGLLYPFFLVDLLEVVSTRNPKRFQVAKPSVHRFLTEKKQGAVVITIQRRPKST